MAIRNSKAGNVVVRLVPGRHGSHHAMTRSSTVRRWCRQNDTLTLAFFTLGFAPYFGNGERYGQSFFRWNKNHWPRMTLKVTDNEYGRRSPILAAAGLFVSFSHNLISGFYFFRNHLCLFFMFYITLQYFYFSFSDFIWNYQFFSIDLCARLNAHLIALSLFISILCHALYRLRPSDETWRAWALTI